MASRILPDNFVGDPLGYLGNFAGHMMIAGVVIVFSSLFWFFAAGEYPPKLSVVAILWAIYLPIELSQRGSPFWDRIEDIVVTCIYGPMIYLRPFSEVAPGSPELSVQSLVQMAPYIGLVIAHMTVGGGIRLWQSIKQGRNL